MCHDQFGGSPGPFGLANAATAVAAFPATSEELAKCPALSNALAIHTFKSFADVVSVCSRCIERPGTRIGLFLPCFTYWMGLRATVIMLRMSVRSVSDSY